MNCKAFILHRRRGFAGIIRNLLFLVCALAIHCLLIPGAQQARAEDRPALKIGDQKGGTHALMQAAGVLDDIPYTLEWRYFAAAAPLNEALAAGGIDTGLVGDAPFLFAYASGAPIKVIGAATSPTDRSPGSGIVVRKSSPIAKVQDLAGHSIGTVRGSAGHYFALLTLERFGIPPEKVKFVFLGPAESIAALRTGTIDAWSTWEPYLSLAQQQDDAREIVEGTQVPRLAFLVIVANDKAIAGKQALLEDFLIRLHKAREWLQTHTQDYAAVLTRETGLPPSVAQNVARVHAELAAVDVRLDPAFATNLDKIFDLYRRLGVVAEGHDKPHFDQAFAPRFNSILPTLARQ